MAYPENCIRGIPTKDNIKDGKILSNLFEFKIIVDRHDGLMEQSINWEDDETVINFTLNQKKDDGTFQFKIGLVILSRIELDQLNKKYVMGGILSYERQTRDDNPYHGNLLLPSDTPSFRHKQIKAWIMVTIIGKHFRDNLNSI